MEYFIIGGAAFLLGFIFTPAARFTALKAGVVDRPSSKLKKHKEPVPYLGGIAVFFAFLIPVIAAKFITGGTLHGVIGIVAGAAIMLVLGLVDDIKNLTPYVKLVVQFFAALLLVGVNIHIKFMDNNIFNIVLTVLWVVGITNAFNIIDIMDGLAGGVALIASFAFFVMAALVGRVNDMVPAVALAGAVAAFLFFNKPPAKIYLGDAGSLFLGFMMAALALNESYSVKNHIAVLSPLLILGVPIFDTFLVMVIRLRKGLLPIYGSDDHLAQRIVMIGLSKKQAVFFLALLTLFLSALAVVSVFLETKGALVLYLGVTALVIMFAMLVMSVDMRNYHKAQRKK